MGVGIYLQETLTTPSGSFLNAEGGLSTAGAALNVVGTTGGSAAEINSGAFTIPSAFGGPQTIVYDQGGNDLEFNESIAYGQSTLEPTAGENFAGRARCNRGNRYHDLRTDFTPR